MARTLIAVGGPIHGQNIDVPDDRKNHLDIASGDAYIVRPIMVPKSEEKVMSKDVLMHQEIIGDGQAISQLLIDAVMGQWLHEGGEEIDAPPSLAASPVAPAPPGGPGTRTTRSGLVLP